ncbi:MAG: cation diffusion facilitator family transporter [Chloroflexi bacterium]|nr:cation diffusion facilitator family transporter [Chloroflexota bacterium]
MASESKTAVIAAMGANSAIAAGKLTAGVLTGSASMLAEAGHSVADTVNQVFLLIGINLSSTSADARHPHGYGKEAFFWSFLAAIFIFVAGAAFSFYEGTRTLLQETAHHRSQHELFLAFGVLGMAAAFESASMTVAVRAIFAGARQNGWGPVRFLRESPDLTTKTVFFEDGAALTGLTIAAAGLALSEITGHEAWDGLASLAIGVVLAIVAVMLGAQSRALLLGAAAGGETQEAIRKTLASFPEVERVPRLLTMQLGSHSVLVTGELEVERSLDAAAIEDLMLRIDASLSETAPEVVDTFWELRREPRGPGERPRHDPHA